MLDTFTLFWTDFKAALTAKGLLEQIQYIQDSDTYTIFAYDVPMKYVCTIYKGTVPTGVQAYYSQATNDSDKSDFTTNYQSESNRRLNNALGYTYNIAESASGPSGGGPSGTNKAMVSIMNPSGSGKHINIRGFSVQAETSSGTGVIVLYELRQITAHTAGTAVTIIKRCSSDPTSIAQVYNTPASVTGSTRAQSFIIQANTAQGPTTYFLPFGTVGEDPICLLPGEGLVAHQVTGNGGTFHIGLVWTETVA